MVSVEKTAAIATWKVLLNDRVALLENPGAHHKMLLSQAHALRRSEVINGDDLSDLLEFADSALGYAIAVRLDEGDEEIMHWPI